MMFFICNNFSSGLIESFLAHSLGEDGDGLAAQELGIIGPSAAIVSGGEASSLAN